MQREQILTAWAALFITLPLLAQPQQFTDGTGTVTVHPMPFGDAVGRVVMDVETPSGALFNFETLVTLNRVSITAFVDDGFVSMTERCGRLQHEAGSGSLASLGYYAPELKSWTAADRGSNLDLRTACGGCAGGSAAACRTCASHTIAAFVGASGCPFNTMGDGSDNGDHGSGGTGSEAFAAASCGSFSLLGDGSDNGDHGSGGTGSESVYGTMGDGSDNGDHGSGGTGSEAFATASCASLGLLGDGSDNGDHGSGGTGSD